MNDYFCTKAQICLAKDMKVVSIVSSVILGLRCTHRAHIPRICDAFSSFQELSRFLEIKLDGP